jgi:hypothetical protein
MIRRRGKILRFAQDDSAFCIGALRKSQQHCHLARSDSALERSEGSLRYVKAMGNSLGFCGEA